MFFLLLNILNSVWLILNCVFFCLSVCLSGWMIMNCLDWESHLHGFPSAASAAAASHSSPSAQFWQSTHWGFPSLPFPYWSSPWGIRCWRTWRGLSCTWWGRPRLCGGIFPGRNPGARLSDKRFLLLLHATVIWFYWGHLCTLIKCIFTPHWFFSKLSHDERFQSGCGWKNTSKAFLFHTYLPGTRALTWLGPRWEPKHRKQQEWQDGPWWQALDWSQGEQASANIGPEWEDPVAAGPSLGRGPLAFSNLVFLSQTFPLSSMQSVSCSKMSNITKNTNSKVWDVFNV